MIVYNSVIFQPALIKFVLSLSDMELFGAARQISPFVHKSQRFCHLHGLFPPPCRRFSATLPEHLATKSSASASTGRAAINFLILGYAPHSCSVSSQHAKRNNNPRILVFAAIFLRRSLQPFTFTHRDASFNHNLIRIMDNTIHNRFRDWAVGLWIRVNSGIPAFGLVLSAKEH